MAHDATAPAWLEPGRTCWRTARADRAAMLIDNSAYFAAALAAVRKARRQVLLLAWQFDPRTQMSPDGALEPGHPDEIGVVLNQLVKERPHLDVRLLVWKSALPIAASQDFFPHRGHRWFEGSPVHFRLDAAIPFGACHHQKVLVIDDKVAFCGGGDIAVDRWDSPLHLDANPRRRMPSGVEHPPRHEVMMVMQGEAARALGDLARERWFASTGAAAPPPPEDVESDPWPEHVAPEFEDVEIGIARTLPAWRNQHEVRETEALHLESIHRAKRLIYLENQYVTSPVIIEALARRLAEEDGPEVVIVSTGTSPSWFDQATMDKTRSTMIAKLEAADHRGRFRAYCPLTRSREVIIVHSKVTIIDDEMLRVGSTNLNNRSAGFDSELDVAFIAETDAHRQAIARFRARDVAHFVGYAPSLIEELTAEKGLIAAIDQGEAVGEPRLLRLRPQRLGPLATFIAAFHLGDPLDPLDAWRPFLRKRRLQKKLVRLDKKFSDPPAPVDLEIDHKRKVVARHSR
ncbi:MAG TPA: phospholipase D-like domain-containing protein [Caulobacteraceae bacterium]